MSWSCWEGNYPFNA